MAMARTYGRAPLVEWVYGVVPGHWDTSTLACGLRLSGVTDSPRAGSPRFRLNTKNSFHVELIKIGPWDSRSPRGLPHAGASKQRSSRHGHQHPPGGRSRARRLPERVAEARRHHAHAARPGRLLPHPQARSHAAPDSRGQEQPAAGPHPSGHGRQAERGPHRIHRGIRTRAERETPLPAMRYGMKPPNPPAYGIRELPPARDIVSARFAP